MVGKLIQAERLDDAQRLCSKWKADRSDTLPELRVACSKAFWSKAESEDTVEAWRSYRGV